MANFWENDPVVSAPTDNAAAPATPLRINIGKMPKNDSRGALPGDGSIRTATGIGPAPEVIPPELLHDSDMGRAAAAGGASGPLALAGAPVELPTMVAKGLAAIPNLVGLDPKSRIYNAVDKVTPDVGTFTNAIRRGVTKVDNAAHSGNTGYESPFAYQPKDPREQLAYNMASGVTSTPMAPVAGALGAGASTVAGDAFKGTPLEVPAQLLAGMAGAGTPTAARSYLPRTSAEGIIQKMTADVTPKQWQAAQDLQESGKAVGVPLTGAEAMQQAVGQQGRLGTLQRTLENTPQGEAAFRPMMAARPGAMDTAGRQMLEQNFGPLQAPQAAANAGTNAASGAVQQAINTRTEAGRPFFQPAAGQSKPALSGLDELKQLTDAEIAKSGTLTDKGKALVTFRKQLDQGSPPPTTEVQEQLKAAGLKPGTPGWDQAIAQVAQGENPQQPLGPLMSTNREYARRLSQKYVTGLPADQQAGFAQEIGATLGPLNSKLTDVLSGGSPEYAAGLKIHGELSPEVSRLTNGPVGRIRDADEGLPGQRVEAQAQNLLGDDARPEQIRQTVSDLNKGELANYETELQKQGLQKNTPPFMAKVAQFEPTAARLIVGSHLEKMFNTATEKNMAGPSLFGGAKFAANVMGNPQAAENLQATVESLNGKQSWPGVKKFMDVMQATGKRKAAGSETQMNLEQQAELNKGSGAVNFLAKGLNPMKIAEAAGNFVDSWSAKANAKQLSDLLTHPDAVKKMQEMSLWAPNSARAKLLAAQAIQLANPANYAQENGTRGTSLQAPAAPAQNPQGQPAWMPPETDQLYAPGANGPVSALDRDSAIRTMYGEAVGEGPEGQSAVAHVILNRAKSGKFGDTIHQVVMAPHQFEPWNDPRDRSKLENLRADSPVYHQLGEIFDKAAMGEVPDPTKGATHFVAAQLQRSRGKSMPDWARKDAQLAQIGGHTFYAP